MICTFFFFKNGELMATCDICGEFFANVFALGAHKRRCWNLQARVLSDFSSSGDDEFSEDYLPEIGIVSTATLADSEARAIPMLQMLQDDNALMNLATRAEDATSRITDCRIQQTDDLREEFAVNFVPMQKQWRRHVRGVYKLCPEDFWRVFKSVRNQSTKCVDDVLKTVRPLVNTLKKNTGKRWPCSKRSLRQLIRKNVSGFWGKVTITKTLDLSRFQLPGVTKIKFSFVDPVYVWIQQCVALINKGHNLIWSPKTMWRADKRMYGAGVEFGDLLKEAAKSVPIGGNVALMNLSWDSGVTNMKSRSAVPICMQVMNLNDLHGLVLFRMRLLWPACDMIFYMYGLVLFRMRLLWPACDMILFTCDRFISHALGLAGMRYDCLTCAS